jgi:hypothetical protein
MTLSLLKAHTQSGFSLGRLSDVFAADFVISVLMLAILAVV